MSSAYVYDAVRTPFGRYGGALAGIRPDDLATHSLSALLARAPDLDPAQIDDVLLGNANGAGEDNRDVARMAVLLAGLPTSVPGATVNRLCGSSLEAAIQGSRAIETGDAHVVVAGGVESMSRAPWVLLKPGKGFPPGHETLWSTTLGWRMVNPEMPEQWTISLGESAEKLAGLYAISREAQDAFALRSHRLAAEAFDQGVMGEVVPVPGVELERDEGIRPDSSMEKLAKLKPAFVAGGTVTAGNASPLNDGAAMVLLGDEQAARALGREPLARVVSRGVHGVDPDVFGIGPVRGGEHRLGARRDRLGRRGPRRAQRGVRLPVARLPRRLAGARPREGEHPRRRDRDRPSPRRLGRAGARPPRPRAAGPRRRLRRRLAVHRSRPRHRSGTGGMNMIEHDDAPTTQATWNRDAAQTPTSYRREPADAHPALDFEGYKSTRLRHPTLPLVYLPQTITEITGPQLGPARVSENDHDLLAQHAGEPIGERITVSGRVFDGEGKPLVGTMVEIWQANSAGRYLHRWDRWPAPLDPNFSGAGRTVTDAEGRYRFVTIKPGPYPWGNHHNAWRPAHIHFSLLGRAFAQRLVTQMYFPGDPVLPL